MAVSESQQLARSPDARRTLPRILSALGTRLLTQVLTLVVGIVAARALGTDERGTLAVMVAVSGVIGIVGVAGLDTANLYFAGMSPRAFSFAVRWALAYGLAAGAALTGGFLLLTRVWEQARFDLTDTQLIAASALSPIVTTTTLLGVAEAGRGKLIRYNVTVILSVAVYLLGATALTILDRADATSFFGVFAAAQVLTLVVLTVGAAPWRAGEGEAPAVRAYLVYGVRAFVLNALQYAMLRADILMLQAFAGATAVGHYAVAYPLAEALLLVAVAVNLVVLPGAAREVAPRQHALRQATIVLAGTSVCAVVGAVAAPDVIPRVFGEEFRPSTALFLTLLPGMVAFNFGRVLQTHLTAANRFSWTISAAAASLVTLIALELALIPSRGATGAAIATSISYGLFSFLVGTAVIVSGRRSSIRAGGFRSPAAPSRSLRQLVCATDLRVKGAVAMLALVPVATVATLVPTVTAVAVAGLALVIALVRPGLGLTMLAGSAPFAVAVGSNVPQAYAVLVGLLMVVLLGLVMRRGASWTRTGWLVVIVSVYIASSFLLLGAGQAAGTVFDAAYPIITLCGPLLLIPLHPPNRSLVGRNATAYLVSSVLVSAWYLIAARDTLAAASGPAWIAVSSAEELGNHNLLGAQIILSVAILLPRLGEWRHPLVRAYLFGALGILIAAALLSFSRATYLALPVIVCVFVFRRGLKGVSLGVLVALATLQLLPESVRARISFTTSGQTGGLDASSAVRLELWQSAASMFQDSPLVGVGLYDFGNALSRYWELSLGYNLDLSNNTLVFAHNTPLTILSQLGLIGAGLLALIGYSLARRTAEALRTTRLPVDGETALLAFVGIGVVSLFGEPLFNIALLCPFLMVLSLDRTKQEGRPTP